MLFGMSPHLRAAHRIANECICTRVRAASRLFTKIYDAEMRSTGLQDSQVGVLVAIAHFGEAGASVGDLARVLMMDRTTLTRNLKPLEKAAYVRVARSPNDARARVIILTRAGERMIETALPLWEKAQKKVRDTLGPKLFETLGADLRQVVKIGP